MSNSPKGQLRNKIRDAILKSTGSDILISKIVDKVIAENPKLIEQEKQRLIKASLSHIVRQVMHTPNSGHQLSFPLGDLIPNLPSRIPIRDGAKNGPAIWAELDELTYGQLKQQISELNAKRKPSSTVVALIRFEKLVRPLLKSDAESELLGPAIKKLLKIQGSD